jgi:probable HAF family extracellular repeat protein
MKPLRVLRYQVTVAGLAMVSAMAASNHTRTLMDLGPGWATGVNARCQVVGVSLAGAEPHAFIWENGNLTELNGLGNVPSYAAAINDRGEVVGSYYPKPGEAHAFIWDKGKMIDLGTLGGSSSVANGVNNRSQVVGVVFADTERAFLWDNGKMTDLGVMGQATDINNRGEIVGYLRPDVGLTHAFVGKEGLVVDLGTLTGGSNSYAYAINDAGEIVGVSETNKGMMHAVVWREGTIFDLGAHLSGDGEAKAINNAGLIVGWTYGPFASQLAIKWNRQSVVELGTLGGDFTVPLAVNDAGDIAGQAYNSQLMVHAFLLGSKRGGDCTATSPFDEEAGDTLSGALQ